MPTNLYLAVTGAEFRSASVLPSPIAWMACHFSPYSTGLSNIPDELPEGSVLMLNDITPIQGHDPQTVQDQLFSALNKHHCDALVLDFQRHPSPQTQALTEVLTRSPPCPVVVSVQFAEGLPCPVLLPPCPAHVSLAEHIAPWSGRDIWLEISRGMEAIAITASGASVSSQPFSVQEGAGFSEETLHCHYRCEADPSQIRFSLWRTDEDIRDLCLDGTSMGIQGFLGLYQELGEIASKNENRSA